MQIKGERRLLLIEKKKEKKRQQYLKSGQFLFGEGLFNFMISTVRKLSKCLLEVLRAILRESEAKLEMKNFKPSSIFVWR